MKVAQRALGAVFCLFSVFSHADDYFNSTRTDNSVPSSCLEMDLVDFESTGSYFVYGVQGSKKKGFDYEVDITRYEAAQLWDIFKNQRQNDISVVEEVQKDSHLAPLFQTLVDNAATMGFDFQKEGDILELLSLVDLQQRFPTSDYFHTGGWEYRASSGDRTLGELDLIVARRSDCQVVAVGESKLGVKQLHHAWDQLHRIHNFLKQRLCGSANFILFGLTSGKPAVCSTPI